MERLPALSVVLPDRTNIDEQKSFQQELFFPSSCVYDPSLEMEDGECQKQDGVLPNVSQ